MYVKIKVNRSLHTNMHGKDNFKIVYENVFTSYERRKKNNAWHPLQTSLGSGLWNMEANGGRICL